MAGRTHNNTRFRWLNCIAALLVLSTSIQGLAQTVSKELIANSIRIKTDTQNLYLGDVLVIDIESIGLLEELDISPLLTDADFIRETHGTMISVIDGKVAEIAVRRIELIPKNEGLIVLGPLSGDTSQGLVSSNAFSVTVASSPEDEWLPEPGDVKIEARVNKTNPYVGEQFELEIQLHHQYAVAAESFTLPDFTGFDVTPIHEERRLVNNDTDMRTTSWRYLLHAQRSGVFELTGPTWQATLVRSRVQRHDFAVDHAPIHIEVAAVPDNFPENTWWLAAESLSLSDSWSSDVIQLSAGDEITRTINLTANGVLANHLPEVKPLATRSFHSTPLPIKRSEELISNTTRALGLYEFRMIAESPVSVFLDTVRVPWFNTRTRKIEEAIIPSRRIDILLPTRPDQLAEIAIQRHRLNRFRLWVGSISVRQWVMLTAALLVIVLCLGSIHPHRLSASMARLKESQRRMKWQYWASTGQWRKLYDALARTPCPFTNTIAVEPLKTALGNELFSTKNASPSSIEKAIRPHWRQLKRNTPISKSTVLSDDLPTI